MGVRLDNARFTTRYIGRYAKRPAMSESRIKGYDGVHVTFEYEDKIEKEHRVLTLLAEEFLIHLIRHIHTKYFRQIRYAGIYSSRTREHDVATGRMVLRLTRGKQVYPPSWRERRRQRNGADPLVCHHCGAELELVKIVYRSRDGPLEEMIF